MKIQSFFESNRNPNEMCGYESIWIALVCKKSHLVKKYNLNRMEDLYMLLRYGNDNYPSLFEEKNVKKFYENCSQKLKNSIDDFKDDLFLKNETAIEFPYYILISIYFNIEIILHLTDECKVIHNTEDDKIKINTYQRFYQIPEQFIHLQQTIRHVEYIPEYYEMTIYNQCKERTNLTKLVHEENLAHQDFYQLMKCDYSDEEQKYFNQLEKEVINVINSNEEIIF